MKNVLFIVGSLRKGSYNRQLSLLAKKDLEGKANVEELDFSSLSFLNQDEEYPEKENVHAVRQKVLSADLLVFITPEYNHSIPSQVKNLVDTLSRPVTPGDYASVVIKGKKAVLLGTSGNSAAAFSRAYLKDLLTFVGAQVAPVSFGHALTKDEWVSGTLLLKDEEKEQLAAVLDQALAF